MVGAVLVIGATGLYLSANEGNPGGDWKTTELTPVDGDTSFTIDTLEKPVLVESFAVWCTTCTRQQQEIKQLLTETNVSVVSLDVDPNEEPALVRDHIEEHGFGWRYAIAPSAMTQQMVADYGTSITNPPSAPAVLVCENSTRRLPNGVKPASKLQDEINAGC
ncbi:MAG: thioredoxin domain-containing protein [Candidatus Nanohaloarchaeota archaeon QJJ-5]|nr:thioredoxin domain-containing protein [Candidatus Nanohaloarchaeota archaeon QJJ-5]